MFTMNALSNPETGELAFDPNIRSIKSQMVNIATNAVGSLSGSLDSLDDIGITLNREGLLEVGTKEYGSIASGTDTLNDALDNSLKEIGEIFASSDGVGSQMLSLIDSYNGSDGSLTNRNSQLQADRLGISDEYDALEEKLRNYEDTLRKRFTFLDQTVAQYNATSEWLASTLAAQSKDND